MGYLPASYILHLKILNFQTSVCNTSNSKMYEIDVLLPSSECMNISRKYVSENYKIILSVSRRLRKSILTNIFNESFCTVVCNN